MDSYNDLETTIATTPGHVAAPKMKVCPKYGMERLPTTKVCPADGTPLADNPASTTSLRHPNIIMVHEFGVTEDGEPFMVMDFIEGSNLVYLIKEKGSLTVEESLHRFIQLCDALEHAHSAGVLHRDLKPGNVMLSSADGSFADARLVDFGIAKLMTKEGEEAEKLMETGHLFGSPLYMSPEQCRGFKHDS